VTDFVLDSSIALSWFFEDEHSEAADRLLDALETEAAVVPPLWYLEMANILALGERRRRTTPARITEFVTQLQDLAIVADEEMAEQAFVRVLNLARSERLTAYDACYLELAMRRGLPLATKDRALAHAAIRLGVSVVGAD
jgi:predicted nucleic acid-binding protein